MRLYRFETLEELNTALDTFSQNRVPVAKVKLLTESTHANKVFELRTVYFVLTDDEGNYQDGKAIKKSEKKGGELSK